MNSQEQYLWVSLFSVFFGVFALGFYDSTLRPEVIKFAHTALGGILALLTARASVSRNT
jgi:hypothetical protein